MDEAQGIYVGWVARKGSFADALPLQNERGDVVLLFAGEEFPEPGSVTQLKARGGMAVVLDSGDYPACQRDILAHAGWEAFPERQRTAVINQIRSLGSPAAHSCSPATN